MTMTVLPASNYYLSYSNRKYFHLWLVCRIDDNSIIKVFSNGKDASEYKNNLDRKDKDEQCCGEESTNRKEVKTNRR